MGIQWLHNTTAWEEFGVVWSIMILEGCVREHVYAWSRYNLSNKTSALSLNAFTHAMRCHNRYPPLSRKVSKLESLPSLGCLQNFLQPPHMDPRVVCELWMEAAAEHVALSNCNDVLLPGMVVLLVLL